MMKVRIPSHACHVTGSTNAIQFCLPSGFAIKACTKLSIKTGKKSTTSLRAAVIVKSAAAISISLSINLPERDIAYAV